MTTRVFNGLVGAAFAILRKEGWFARQNFTCCQSCAWSEVRHDEPNVVFYHAQDRANALESGKLYLAWKGDAARIKAVLEHVGLTVEHDGSEDTRILVTNP